MSKEEKKDDKSLSKVTNQEEEQNHEEEEELATANNNDAITTIFNNMEEEERAIQAGEKYKDFDLERFIKTLERDTAFTKLYTDKKDESVLKEHIKKNLQKSKYEVTNERLEEILSKWKAINEPPKFDLNNPTKFVEWLEKYVPVWNTFTNKPSKQAYLKKHSKKWGLDTDDVKIIIGLKPTKSKRPAKYSTSTTKKPNKTILKPLTHKPELLKKIKQIETYPEFLWPLLYPELQDIPLREKLHEITYEWVVQKGVNVETRRNNIEIMDNLANFLVEHIPLFARDDTRFDIKHEIYWYNGKIWDEKGAVLLKRIIEKTVPQSTNYIVRECLDKIQRLTFLSNTIDKIDNPRYLAFQNMVLDRETLEFIPFNKEYYLTYTLPADYKPEADCPEFKELCELLVGKENVYKLQEMFGFCLMEGYPIKEFLVCIGKTDTGKSTFLRILSIFLGNKITSASIQQLSSKDDKWHLADLRYSLANICADIPTEKIVSSDTVKKIVSEDLIRAQQKNRDPFDFINSSKLIFSCNNMPFASDDSDAYINRLVFLAFIHKFTDVDKRPMKDVIEELTTPEELSGMLNWALEGIINLRKRMSFLTEEEKSFRRRYYEARTKPITFMIERKYEFNKTGWTFNKDLYKSYASHCLQYNIEKMSQKEFTRKVKYYFKDKKLSDSTRPDINNEGTVTRCLKGIQKKGSVDNNEIIAEKITKGSF